MITFKDVMPWVISGLSLFFAWWTNNKKDLKDSAVVISTVNTQLTDLKEKLNEKLSEISQTMRSMVEDSKDHSERLAALEANQRNLQKEVDKLKEDLANAK